VALASAVAADVTLFHLAEGGVLFNCAVHFLLQGNCPTSQGWHMHASSMPVATSAIDLTGVADGADAA
jgi:hypothetical protein